MIASLSPLHPLQVEQLGWTLIHFAWQGLLLGGVTLGLLRLLRGVRPQARYAIACVGLAVMLAAPVVTFSMLSGSMLSGSMLSGGILSGGVLSDDPQSSGERAHRSSGARSIVGAPERGARATPALAERFNVGANPALVSSSVRSSDDAAADASGVGRLTDVASKGAAAAVAPLQRALPWLVLAWGVGVALLLVRLCGGLLLLGRITQHTRPAQEAWQVRVIVLARQLNVRRAIALRESLATHTPAVVGWMRPVILVPASVLAGLTPRQVEAILAHELAHIRRHDYLVNLLQSIAETLLFYHPAVWLVSRQIRIEREHCCDDAAVEACGDAVTYASALAELERLRGGLPTLALAATDGSLLARVQRLLTPTPRPGFSWPTAAALVMSVLMLGLMATLHGEPSTTRLVGEAAAGDDPGAAAGAVAQDRAASRDELDELFESKQAPASRAHGRLAGEQPPAPPEPPPAPEASAPDAPPPPPALAQDPVERPAAPPAPPAPPVPAKKARGAAVAAPPAPPAPPAARASGRQGGSAAPPAPPAPPTPGRVAAPPAPAAPPSAPAAPGVMAPPPPPPPPPAMRESSFMSWLWGNDLPRSSYSISNGQGRRLAVLSRGNIELRDDDADITRIDEGGYFKVEERMAGARRRVEVRARNGQLERRWLRNGVEAPYDNDAKQWLAKVLEELARSTGLGAEKRVARILSQRGPAGVVDAANATFSDHVKRLYLDAALSSPALDQATLMRILNATPTIDSDYEQAELLRNALKRGLTTDDAKLAYVKGTETIDSDYERSRTLQALVDTPLSSAVLAAALKSGAEIDSDYELAQLLDKAARRQTLDAETSLAFATASGHIDSAFELRRALTPLAERPTLPADAQSAMLTSASSINSDFERAELLSTIASKQQLTETARPTFFKAVNQIDSSYERTRTLQAVMKGQNPMTDPIVRDVIGSTLTIDNDHERANVLTWVATHHALTGPTREAFMQASSRIDSEAERNRVLVSLVRKDAGSR